MGRCDFRLCMVSECGKVWTPCYPASMNRTYSQQVQLRFQRRAGNCTLIPYPPYPHSEAPGVLLRAVGRNQLPGTPRLSWGTQGGRDRMKFCNDRNSVPSHGPAHGVQSTRWFCVRGFSFILLLHLDYHSCLFLSCERWPKPGYRPNGSRTRSCILHISYPR